MIRDPIEFRRTVMDEPDVVRVWLPLQDDPCALCHPDHARRMLLTDRETFRKSDDFAVAFGDGLLTTEGEEWRRQRDTLRPLFTHESVRGYAETMTEQIRRRVRRWEDGQRLVLQREFADMALDVLFAALLGRELDLDGDRELRRAAEHLHDWFVPSSYTLPEWVPTPSRRRFERAKSTIRGEADRLLAERSGTASTDPREADDLLSVLAGLRASGMAEDTGMCTEEQLRDQVVTIIFAGHDTTTTTLTFATWAIANHPDVRERFHEEVDALSGPPTVDDLDDLAVTERIITETLRMFPPVYALPRRTDTAVAVDGYRIPGERWVIAPVVNIHRDERWYDDPETFRPARWRGDLRGEIPDFAYLPFGAGPRICIGREFALVEAKLALATIGRRYDCRWLGENTRHGEPPSSPEMTLRMEPGQEFLVTER